MITLESFAGRVFAAIREQKARLQDRLLGGSCATLEDYRLSVRFMEALDALNEDIRASLKAPDDEDE